MYEQELQIQKLVDEGKLAEAATLGITQALSSLQMAALICSKMGDPLAVKLIELCIEITPNNPNLYGNLSFFLGNQNKPELALEAIDKAIALVPTHTDFLYNKAVLLTSLNRIQESIETYKLVLASDPQRKFAHHTFAKFCMGCMMCKLGNYKEGLPLLESRFEYDTLLTKFRARFKAPDWTGQDLNGKTILLYSEQGMGDLIQYVRYVDKLRNLGAKVIGEIQEELVCILGFFFDETIGRSKTFNVEADAKLPQHDYVASFCSLPSIIDPELKNIPSTPYLIQKERLPARCGGFFLPTIYEKNIGIVWSGEIANPNDRNRSCPVKYFKKISELPLVQLYSLQKGSTKRKWDGKEIDLSEGIKTLDIKKLELTDFTATTKILNDLDLVITVDTAMAHLAGAMGKPVWLMLTYAYDWRWEMNRTDSIWYKSMKLFWQDSPGDWDGVMDKIVKELQQTV